jgi:cysteinyl-tRNA synthetase
VFPRATEHISEMLALAEALVERGHAYVSPDRNVYYEVASYPDYGRLSGNTLDHLRAGHRGDVESDKRDSADFALWKAAGEGRLLRWPSPWGDGYPGWHLECSAMARRYLGDRFDLHSGGVDNVFPHHEDELAQSAPVVGGPLARHWVHGEHLLASGQKMAKSAGNFERVTELPDGVEPLALRYLAMTVRYRRKLEYSPGSISAAAAALRSLRSRLAALGPAPSDGPWRAPDPLVAGEAPARPQGVATGLTGHGAPVADGWLRDRAHAPSAPLSDAGRALHDRFVDALDEDLDLPAALSVVREILRSDLPADERRWLVLDADVVLGLDLDRVWDQASSDGPDLAELDSEAAALIEERTRARAARDWATADALRDRLAGLGIEVEDRPDGTTAWRATTRA